jgi:hypothetical protein
MFFNPSDLGLLIIVSFIEPDMLGGAVGSLLLLASGCLFTVGYVLTARSAWRIGRRVWLGEVVPSRVWFLGWMSLMVLFLPIVLSLAVFKDKMYLALSMILLQGIVGLALTLLTSRSIDAIPNPPDSKGIPTGSVP